MCSVSGENLNIMSRTLCSHVYLREMTEYSAGMKAGHPHYQNTEVYGWKRPSASTGIFQPDRSDPSRTYSFPTGMLSTKAGRVGAFFLQLLSEPCRTCPKWAWRSRQRGNGPSIKFCENMVSSIYAILFINYTSTVT